jgi:phage shock protein PspC (stress-responsive transcriptional regulator)
MTSPPPYPAPKRLERSRSNRVLGGVCAGLANYLNMDPTLVRVLTVVISLFTGVPILIYLVLMLVLPEEQEQGPQPGVSPAGSAGYGQPIPPSSTRPATDPVWGPVGAPWEQQATTAPRAQTPPPAATPPPAEAPPPAATPEDRPEGNSLR